MKSTTVREVEELTATFQPDMLEPNTKADMIFLALADLSRECQKYGEVLTTAPPYPSQCTIMGKGVDTEGVGKKSTAVLQTLDFNGQPCKVLQDAITCELVSEIVGTSARGSVERRRHSQYEISYQPTIKGRHQLHIKVEGQHIKGSPFPVSARSQVEKLGIPILTIGGVNCPAGVAVNRRGEIVVVECSGHCVTVFSPSGQRLRSFSTRGSGQGQFQFPCVVAVDGEENVLVADRENYRIQKFTVHGEFLTAVGAKGSGPLQFVHPRGIALNASNGRVYMVDSENNRIQILNSDLSYFGTFGNSGSGKGQLNGARHIACDSTGKV